MFAVGSDRLCEILSGPREFLEEQNLFLSGDGIYFNCTSGHFFLFRKRIIFQLIPEEDGGRNGCVTGTKGGGEKKKVEANFGEINWSI